MGLLFRAIVALVITLLSIFPMSCAEEETPTSEKISGLLLTQVNLKKEQIDEPTTDRLNMMRQMGMMVDNLENHLILTIPL